VSVDLPPFTLSIFTEFIVDETTKIWDCEKVKFPPRSDKSFWVRFPTTEPAFREYVRDRGIRITFEDPPSRRSHVKSQYGGTSAAKMARMLKRHRQGKEVSLEPRDLFDQFAIDQLIEQAERDHWWGQMCAARPRPPEGYYWYHDSGGLHGAWTPFCLWHRALGRPRLSE
jgi:hypothetical protein